MNVYKCYFYKDNGVTKEACVEFVASYRELTAKEIKNRLYEESPYNDPETVIEHLKVYRQMIVNDIEVL